MQVSGIATVRELAALMRAHGVTRCVLCPGSRNSPIVRTLSNLPDVTCCSVTDERSAGYVALGWSAANREPVAVCVTSGTALLNLHPAVAEAYYRQLPLLVLSADRPAAWIGQQDGQTLPQPDALAGLLRFRANLPEQMTSTEEAWHTNRLINEALLALRGTVPGPVHLNIPLHEPLSIMQEGDLPTARVIRREDAAELNTAALSTLPRRMLLLGQLPAYPAWAERFRDAGWAVVGEHLSNAQDVAQTRPEALLRTMNRKQAEAIAVPDLLITYGGCLISKRLKELLRHTPPREHWHLSEDGALIDTFRCLTRCISGTPEQLAARLCCDEIPAADQEFAKLWHTPAPAFGGETCGTTFANAHAEATPLGMQVTASALSRLQVGDVLHLANSSAVRYAQLCSIPAGVQVECNRGTNGIEGSLSTAIGYALHATQRQLLIIGDLSFFYDMNALGIPGIGGNLRILLLNNGCGGIFSTLPGPPNHLVMGSCHTSAQGWAESCGFAYRAVRNNAAWDLALPELMAEQAATPILVEVFTNAKADATALSTL